MIRAVLFDFGGVILTSPFEAFESYERRVGLPPGTIRSINATNPDNNAWARLERSELDLDSFVDVFEHEARGLGHVVSGAEVLECLTVEMRPEMVGAIQRLRESFAIGLLTNNFLTGSPDWSAGGSFADLVGSVRCGGGVIARRLPQARAAASTRSRWKSSTSPRSEAVFLDDLGINLKPARGWV